VQRRLVRVTGVVQGVGMRPFVHRLAEQLELSGWVGNDAAGVFCEVEGPRAAIAMFVDRMSRDAPAQAVVESVTVHTVATRGDEGFRIVESLLDGPAAVPVALVPPDMATCADCLREMNDPDDRRYRYPFIACTFCGPRFTIVRGVPYDRPFTTMAAFDLCEQCQAEYDDPTDRRFHAQPTACPRCGPRLRWHRPGGADADLGDNALAQAIRLLLDGGVVAVKGVGGYHLACDARRPEAVARLRSRKRRSAKPFALLAANLDVARSMVDVDGPTGQALSSPQAPVVLAPARLDEPEVRALRDSVAPGQSQLGVMLPYSGVHHLLTAEHPDLAGPPLDLLVLTSANLADEPICSDSDEAEQRLAGLADAWLHHDRPIHLACDDSVVRLVGPRGAAVLQPVRRSRGYAPLPVRLPADLPPVLAVGGELKAAVCLAQGRRGWMSQHLGDVASLEALELLTRTVDVLGAQSRVAPEIVAADMHPGYLSRRWAHEHAERLGARLALVQHHHAHLAALLAEHEWPADEPVLGVTFDGTGYGLDGSIWGGELLLGSYLAVQRVAHLAPVSLPGGDAALRHPARVALAHLTAAGVDWNPALLPVRSMTEAQVTLLRSMLRSGSGCTPTTSMGRLFDAVSSLAGVCQEVGYEGQAAMELEALLGDCAPVGESYPVGIDGASSPMVLDPAPLVRACVRDVLAGVGAAEVSRRFHRGIAAMVRDVATEIRVRHSVATVGLTGGVFQNAWMTQQCRSMLEGAGFDVLVHRHVPPNDGGLALGQAVIAGLGGGE
jgi:hydrogenase maturation protein HypF